MEGEKGVLLPKNGWPLVSIERETIPQRGVDIQELHWFRVRWVHDGKFEATYKALATSQEEANAYVAEHRLECEYEDVLPLSDDYQQYL